MASGTPSKRVRKELALEDKVKLIKKYDSCKIGHRALAEQFQIGKTQVQCILKRKREYLDAYEECANSTSKRPCVTNHRGTSNRCGTENVVR